VVAAVDGSVWAHTFAADATNPKTTQSARLLLRKSMPVPFVNQGNCKIDELQVAVDCIARKRAPATSPRDHAR